MLETSVSKTSWGICGETPHLGLILPQVVLPEQASYKRLGESKGKDKTCPELITC